MVLEGRIDVGTWVNEHGCWLQALATEEVCVQAPLSTGPGYSHPSLGQDHLRSRLSLAGNQLKG